MRYCDGTRAAVDSAINSEKTVAVDAEEEETSDGGVDFVSTPPASRS